MKRNILFVIIGVLIVILSVYAVFKYNEQYKDTEEITATIYEIRKEKYEWTERKSGRVGETTRVGYQKQIYYEFEYESEQKTGETDFYNIFWRENTKIKINYDKKTDTSRIYIHPYILYYFIIIGVEITAIGFAACKNNRKVFLDPIVIHIALPLMASIIFWAVYIENECTKVFPSFLMFCFMAIHIILLYFIYKGSNKPLDE